MIFFQIEKSDLVSQTTEVKLKNNLSIVMNCMLKIITSKLTIEGNLKLQDFNWLDQTMKIV